MPNSHMLSVQREAVTKDGIATLFPSPSNCSTLSLVTGDEDTAVHCSRVQSLEVFACRASSTPAKSLSILAFQTCFDSADIVGCAPREAVTKSRTLALLPPSLGMSCQPFPTALSSADHVGPPL
eukprot:scpid96349/ scgid19327/ 